VFKKLGGVSFRVVLDSDTPGHFNQKKEKDTHTMEKDNVIELKKPESFVDDSNAALHAAEAINTWSRCWKPDSPLISWTARPSILRLVEGVRSMRDNANHVNTSPFTSYNYHGKGNFASMLDVVILGATEAGRTACSESV
jgi:hypothetical protein